MKRLVEVKSWDHPTFRAGKGICLQEERKGKGIDGGGGGGRTSSDKLGVWDCKRLSDCRGKKTSRSDGCLS